MKANKVLKILQVTRPTLVSYVKSGKIKATRLTNGYWDYNDDSVYELVGLKDQRKVVVYSRVSTNNQKKSLESQIEANIKWANKNGYKIDEVYQDIASGMNFDRNDFKKMIMNVMKRKIKTIIISHKDRFSRISFDVWNEICKEFDCNIVVINNVENEEKEIFQDIISLIHCFAMKMYSKRKRKKLELIEEDLKIENDIVVKTYFDGIACTISTASTDILCDLILNKSKSDALYILEQYTNMIFEKEYNDEVLDEALVFANTHKQAARIKCATIGWNGMSQILEAKKNG